MKAVIMAGGKGTRLRPLTCNIPKPMVPLLDRPVMEYAIELLRMHGITEIAVTVHHLSEVIRHYFGDGSEFGVRLHYFEEDAPLGTAGSVKHAEAFLDEPFLVISGDALTDFDLSAAFSFHWDKKAVATILLASVEVPLDFGVVMTGADGQIIRFLEKPDWSEVFSDTVNTGIYVLDPDIFRYYDSGVEFDFSRDLFPLLLMMDQPLYGYRAEGYWSDIGSLLQYRQTQFDMLDRKVKVSIRGAEILPQIWVGEGVKIRNNLALNAPAYIGNDCVLEDYVHVGGYSVIGSGSMLRREASVERTVLWNHTVIDQGAELKGATLGRHAIVRTGAMVLDGVVIGDGAQIGMKSFVQPGMKVWPNKLVDNYTRLSQSLIWGEQNRKSLIGYWGIKGSCHGELTASFAARLAMSFGSLLPMGLTVGIGHDASPYAALVAEALEAGIHASGLYTHDYGSVTSAVTRHAVYHGDYAGGLHVRRFDDSRQDEFVIECLDRQGLPLDRAAVRRLEQAFAQEDIRRIKPEQAGRRTAAPVSHIAYREHLLRLAEIGSIRDMSYTVVIHCDYRNHQGIIPELLEALGCRVIQISDPEAGWNELSSMVTLTRADLGISLDFNGLMTDLIGEDGLPVDEETMGMLQIFMQLHADDGALYVPVNWPGIVEGLGESANREVIRTKADLRSMMEGCQREGFHLRFDGVCMLILLLEYMAMENRDLSELTKRIPRFGLSKRKVECPWQDKGKVMRYLMEEMKGKQVDLVDGIKIYHDTGWTLILPDSDEPAFRVVAHAPSSQMADELAGVYARKIEDFRRKTTAS